MIVHFYPAGGTFIWPSDIEKIRIKDKKRMVESTTNDHRNKGKMDMDELLSPDHIFRQVNFEEERKRLYG